MRFTSSTLPVYLCTPLLVLANLAAQAQDTNIRYEMSADGKKVTLTVTNLRRSWRDIHVRFPTIGSQNNVHFKVTPVPGADWQEAKDGEKSTGTRAGKYISHLATKPGKSIPAGTPVQFEITYGSFELASRIAAGARPDIVLTDDRQLPANGDDETVFDSTSHAGVVQRIPASSNSNAPSPERLKPDFDTVISEPIEDSAGNSVRYLVGRNGRSWADFHLRFPCQNARKPEDVHVTFPPPSPWDNVVRDRDITKVVVDGVEYFELHFRTKQMMDPGALAELRVSFTSGRVGIQSGATWRVTSHTTRPNDLSKVFQEPGADPEIHPDDQEMFYPVSYQPAGPQTAPGTQGPATTDTVFSVASLSLITSPAPLFAPTTTQWKVQAIHATKSGLPGLLPGQFAVALTVVGLSSYYGGDPSGTGTGVVLGLFDRTTSPGRFVPTTLANSLCAAASFGLSIEPRDGLVAAVDHAVGPMVATRSSQGGAFGTPIPVVAESGPALPAWVDPAPTYLDGQLVLVYADGKAIVYRPLMLEYASTGALDYAYLQGQPRVLWSPSSGKAHSPNPIVDGSGAMRGLLCAHAVGSDSDMVFLAGTTPAGDAVVVSDENGWQNNGTLLGGSLLYADSQGGYQAMRRVEIAWLLGSEVAPGSTSTISLGAPANPNTRGLIYLGLGTTTPLSIPGVRGALGLAAPMLPLLALGCDPDGLAHWSWNVPKDPTYRGLRFAIQGATFDNSTAPMVLTNTAPLGTR
ncbi:MAG: hypothetical protein KDC87_08685 [Planctomycetes bacterium]|nr:hypothetical protein [Planctomycetota bacterium]MCB9870617.1 hypothetical protein [Planctomycetota bacterium]MCB9889484.1 hypothetical protein [Planctomycetota bacterium]